MIFPLPHQADGAYVPHYPEEKPAPRVSLRLKFAVIAGASFLTGGITFLWIGGFI